MDLMTQIKPSTLQEAVAAIRATFPASELEEWAAQPAPIAQAFAHFELGAWIRNEWVYGSGSPLADHVLQRNNWLLNPDTISGIIIDALWLVLNGQPCPRLEEILAEYDEM